MPAGWDAKCFTKPDDETIHAAQLLNTATGVAPAPEYYLEGVQRPSLLACLYDGVGNLAVCAKATMRYQPGGPLAGWIFAESVSVSLDHRRLGLGAYINALLFAESHAAFGWGTALEQVKADNAASVGMIKRCGLRQDPGKVTIVVNIAGGYVTR